MEQTNTFLDTHLDALKLEIALIDKIMRRNRCSHGKTKYFRLLDMACASLRNSNVLDLYIDVTELLKEIPDKSSAFKKRRKREEIFWEFQPSKEKSKADESEVHQLYKRLEQVGNCVACQLPMCLSRFVYASKYFFLEISRGFFLPFCVVTVGAIARVRTLLEQLGRFVLHECWDKLEHSWLEFLGLHGLERAALDVSKICREELQKARSSFAVSPQSVNYNTTRSKADRVAAMLRNLGLPMQLRNSASTTERCNDTTQIEPDGITGEPNRVAEDDHCDRGEIVVAAMSAPLHPVASSGAHSSSTVGNGSGLGQVDRNSEILEKMKEKNKKKEKRSVSGSADASKLKKMRKEKDGKKKTGDFFDDLFSR